jgi:hypothetical protein
LLLLLHGDTWPPEGYAEVIRDQLRHPAVAAGAFRFALREPVPGRPFLEGLVSARCRCFGTPFGDQGLCVRRELFKPIGGFAEWSLLEHVEILRCRRRYGRVELAAAPALTSRRRWQARGVLRTFFINQLVMVGHHAGASPDRLARLYRSGGN